MRMGTAGESGDVRWQGWEDSYISKYIIAGVIGIAVDLVFQTIDIVSVGNFGIGALTSFLNGYLSDKDKMMEQINI